MLDGISYCVNYACLYIGANGGTGKGLTDLGVYASFDTNSKSSGDVGEKAVLNKICNVSN